MLPHPLSPPPPTPPLSGSPSPLFIPPPPPLLAKTIFGSGALAGVFPCDNGWSISCDSCRVISDGSEPWETLPERMNRVMTSSDPAPPPPPPPPPGPGPGDGGGGGGGGDNSLASHVGPTYAHCELECWRRYKTFGCDLNSKFFPYYYWREFNEEKQV